MLRSQTKQSKVLLGREMLTFVSRKARIKKTGYSNLYAVVIYFSSGHWEFANFWGLPYTHKYYLQAVEMKKLIWRKTQKHTGVWKKENLAIVKITLTPAH